MRKGENIFKRKDGRWEARYIKCYEESGKAKYGFCYGKTYKDAKEKVTKRKAELISGKETPVTVQSHTFSFYCEEWLNLHKSKVKESTYIKYCTVLENHIKPKLGDCDPLLITTAVTTSFSDFLISEKGLSPKSVHDVLVVLRSVLKYTAAQFRDKFPVVEINYPKSRPKEMRVLSRGEQKLFAEYLLNNTDLCKFGVLLMLFTGMRIGELCALKWGNVDLIDRTIKISETMQRLHNTELESRSRTRIVIDTPKSETSMRTIPITDYTVSICRKFQAEDSTYILTGTPNYMEPRALQYRINKYVKDCGLEGVHAHTLRHTFATRAVEVGFEIKSLSEILGHSSTSVTLQRYVHSSMELKRANMDKLWNTEV